MSLEVGLESLRTPYHFHFLSLLHDCSSRCELQLPVPSAMIAAFCYVSPP